MQTALIIDDENHIRDTLSIFLARFCPQVNLVGEATGVANGIKAISELKPGLVFLDMNLGDGNAFDLLHAVKAFNFQVVFISSFDRESIQALKLSGLEYLQKPFNPIELAEVVKRMGNQDISHLGLQIKALEENLRHSGRR
ncbi:MAG: response regulator [Bacteroidia bacterium]|nr:response regulator [Bacteroidia bacterium]